MVVGIIVLVIVVYEGWIGKVMLLLYNVCWFLVDGFYVFIFIFVISLYFMGIVIILGFIFGLMFVGNFNVVNIIRNVF